MLQPTPLLFSAALLVSWALATSLSLTVDDGCDDLDLDGFEACDDGSGEDCDDTDGSLNPDEAELCDGIDNDCDGLVDGASALGATSFYADLDLDGYGDPESVLVDCSAPSGYLEDGNDCDDSRATVSPAGLERCDRLGLDEDCDGLEGDLDPDTTGKTTFFTDTDGDGYGDDSSPVDACAAGEGLSALGGDCDDSDIAYNPVALESCADPADYNCDGSVGYADEDGDGYAACVECDDQDALISPEGTERCNTVDDNCDGVVDEASAEDAPLWFIDTDGDGWGSPDAWVVACEAPPLVTQPPLRTVTTPRMVYVPKPPSSGTTASTRTVTGRTMIRTGTATRWPRTVMIWTPPSTPGRETPPTMTSTPTAAAAPTMTPTGTVRRPLNPEGRTVMIQIQASTREPPTPLMTVWCMTATIRTNTTSTAMGTSSAPTATTPSLPSTPGRWSSGMTASIRTAT